MRILKYFLTFSVFFCAKTLAVDRLKRGECLTADQQLTSLSGCFIFKFQSDGNAFIYRIGTNNALTAIYNTQTGGKGADRICMQTDGNLVIYGGTTPYFNTGTFGTAADFVIIQDDGNLVIYNVDGSQYFWNSNTVQSGVTCPAPTTTTQATTTTTTEITTTMTFTLPETTLRPGCDFTRFLFDKDGNFLKLACWVKGPLDQQNAVDHCNSNGMRLFVPSSQADLSAIATTTSAVFGKGAYTSIWISGSRRLETPWRDSNNGGHELFTSFIPNLVDYAVYNPAKCLSLSSFGVGGYQLVTYDCYAAQSFWCEF